MTVETRTQSRWWTRAVVCAAASVAASVLLCAASAWPQMPQPSVRNLTGKITDAGHEPIRNAVVELRNGKTNEVVTYITDATGRYDFKRLDGSTDYQVWVLFRGHHSAMRNISKFDNHMAKVINFTVRTY